VLYLAELWEVVVSLPEKTVLDGVKIFAFYNSEENVEKKEVSWLPSRDIYRIVLPYFKKLSQHYNNIPEFIKLTCPPSKCHPLS